eukprot:CAMPEP_0195067004 /NCGR_PEP_ID=MMETSP0448-20130528/12193_1 /TAXON_ID=66468 /ORGANISM="Heterocapsa triquestra, Strain CCMP 448" /LENGTH=747 /DNA_ID=CAMNT_0040098351 /DNA_START=53 /DNA_END=2296 /DNA_ORIENTATION=-
MTSGGEAGSQRQPLKRSTSSDSSSSCSSGSSSGSSSAKKIVPTDRSQTSFKSSAAQTHQLPGWLMWAITLLTASMMAVINFVTIWIISGVVEWKFRTLQDMIDRHGIATGIVTFISICASLATACMCLIFRCAPAAGSSGAPENKGWLNGNALPGFFTLRNMIVRQFATMLANTSGYPVGREGPTVTMGSNLAFLLTSKLAKPWVEQWVQIDDGDENDEREGAWLIDEERLEHAKRIMCTVGGACGMAMLFDSPVGGIIYMFEEITSASWPMETTMRAFAGTTVCAWLSRALLGGFWGTSTKAFVVYEFTTQPDAWTWKDVPVFMVVAFLVGPVSAYHTKACLRVALARQNFMKKFDKYQPGAKMVEAVIFIVFCAGTYTLVALLGKCFKLAQEEPVEFVRYNCPEGSYNPLASLLLTTSEGGVKRLFSRKNAHELHLCNEVLAFLAYGMLNVCLTGVPVPSGNFTGSMLIGGMLGRIVGAGFRDYGVEGLAASGVYAMLGSAGMLAGFKQMCVAVVVFISGCSNDLTLVAPMMLVVLIALTTNRMINERGFDEEQILRKGIPFLPAEPPNSMDQLRACQIPDDVPLDALLPKHVHLAQVKAALEFKDITDFPILEDIEGTPGKRRCVGFTTRKRLEAAVRAYDSSSANRKDDTSAKYDYIGKKHAEHVVRRYNTGGSIGKLQVDRLADKFPLTLHEDMPVPRLYTLFAKAGVRAAAIVSKDGEYVGMISKRGLVKVTKKHEQEESK